MGEGGKGREEREDEILLHLARRGVQKASSCIMHTASLQQSLQRPCIHGERL